MTANLAALFVTRCVALVTPKADFTITDLFLMTVESFMPFRGDEGP